MNKKGFTLVELLAVIVLLTMVGVFSVSVILEKNDEKREQIDSATKELIITAAKNYVSKNSASFEPKSGNTYCLDLKEVLTKEDIENINANSNKEITLTNTKVKVTYSQNNINYDVVNDCQENVDTLPNAPVLASNMIAIKWDQNNNIVVADQNKYGDWYNYEEKRWANAIVVPKEKLAKYKRELYDIPVVAVTGSVGKTSTKDIIASVLSEKYNVLKTEGNQNNDIGLPFTILKLKDHTAAVI